MSDYLTYQSFHSEEEAQIYAELFSKREIAFRIIKHKQFIDHIIIGESFDKTIELQIPAKDFSRANAIIDQQIIERLDEIDKDYYLYHFNNLELLEVLNNSENWSRQDVIIAKKILSERNIPVDMTKFSIVKKPLIERVDASWLVIGYALSLFGVAGLLAGMSIILAKKVLPDGTMVPMYTSGARTHGVSIVVISLGVMIISLLRDDFLIRNLGGFAWLLF